MKSVIDDYVYHAYDSVNNRIALSNDYKKFSDEGYDIFEKLKETLNEEQKQLLEDFAESTVCKEGEAMEMYFKAGFKYGLRLAVECLETPL